MPKKKPGNEDTQNGVVLNVQRREGEDEQKAIAHTLLRPSIQSALTLKEYEPINTDLNAFADILREQSTAVNNGDLKRAEAMLISQAHVLDAVFGYFMRKAKNSQYIEHLKIYSNMGLRAQSQCRATVEALAEIKNPRPYIQNNKAQYQQVNNGVRRGTHTPLRDNYAHAEENPKSTNELLEDKRNESEWMDTGKAEEAGRTDTKLETVAEKHRPENE